MLDRYRKAGGFVQLLTLLETCESAKREKLLQIIRDQDLIWAAELEARLLSIARIFSWPAEAVAELLPDLQDLTIAVALHGLSEKEKEIFSRTLSHSQKLKIADLFASHKPSAAEISTMFNKILVEARKAISENRIRIEKIDPPLAIPENIEEKLKRNIPIGKVPTVSELLQEEITAITPMITPRLAPAPVAALPKTPPAEAQMRDQLRDENGNLKKKLSGALNENGLLKQELSRLQAKLDQIKKMAV